MPRASSAPAQSRLARVFFAPVTWFIERVRFARSLLLLLLLIPDVYVALLLFQQTTKDVNFSTKESQGVDYITPAYAFLTEVERQRLLAASGDATALKRSIDAADAALEQVGRVDQIHGEAFKTKADLDKVRAQWSTVRSLRDRREQEEQLAALSSQLASGLIVTAGNNSNLILDPDLDSYWMMDAYVFKLPALSALVASAGSGTLRALADGTLSNDERIDLAGTCRQIDVTTDSLLNDNLKSALDDNQNRGDKSLRDAVEKDFRDTAAALRAFTARLRQDILARSTGATAPSDEALTALNAVAGLHPLTGRELKRLCDIRADGYRRTRLAGVFAALVAASLISYVFNGFVRSVGAAQARVEAENRALQGDILGLLEVVSSAADGDLTARAKVGDGTLGNVADAFNQMMESWQSLMAAITDQLVRSTQAVAQLREAAAKMAIGATQQAAEVAQAAGSVQRMTEQIDRVSGNAEDAAAAAKRTQQSAQEGSSSVQDVIQGMESLRALVQAGAKKVKTLGDRSMEITSIVGTIAKISEQTNMLALNAAIEAARAGEQGRGFSVVADEVRKLAERAAGATKEVDRLVRTIQAETGESVLAIERQTQVVEDEGRAVALAGGALARIQDVSSRSSNLAADIAGVARTQAADAHAVAAMMQRISSIARDTEGGAKGSLSIAQGLGELSEELRASIGRFKVS